MKVTKKENVVIFNSSKGEYHLSIEEFNKLGEEKAIEYAESEIEKKAKAEVGNRKITYAICRKFGFCKHGIKEFCKLTGLKVDIDEGKDIDRLSSSFTREEVIEATTIEAFKKYPSEILKLTGKKLLDKWGGARKIIEDYEIYEPFLNETFFTEIELREIACECARATLPFFENEFPKDKAPREAIEQMEKVIQIMKEEGIISLQGY